MIPVRPSLTIPILAVAVFAATLGWFGYRHLRRDPAAAGPAVVAAPAATVPARSEPERDAPVRSAGLAPTLAAPPVAALTSAPVGVGASAPGTAAWDPSVPAFDVVRVEPSGEAVIAGRAPAGTGVELLVNGTRHAETTADAAGRFALVPTPLPAGSHELTLRTAAPGGAAVSSSQSVTVVIADNRRDAPLVAVTAPGQPSVVLSRPEAPARLASADPASPASAGPPAAADAAPAATRPERPTAGLPGAGGPPQGRAEAPRAASQAGMRSGPAGPVSPTRPGGRPRLEIVSVEAEGTGRLYVSGTATPSATVRLYLNETLIAPGTAGPDGRIAFSIERGIRSGSYRVRLDEVDPGSGAVRTRAEVPFTMPLDVAAPTVVASVAPRDPAATSRGAGPEGAPTAGEAASAGGRMPAGTRAGPLPQPDRAAADASARASVALPATVVVPEVATATVSRGQSLWEISRRTYGEGLRYTVIYGANAGQIRDPNLIYPGQIFVIPSSSRQGALR